MTNLQMAMVFLVKTFDTYASTDGDNKTLTKKEAKELLEKELPLLLMAAKNREEVDKLLNGLDFNGDQEVDFTEFMVLVTTVTCACHDLLSKE